jgi:hypothetical protein
MKMNFLNSKTWRFDPENPESKGDFLSDGKRPPAQDSLLPAIPMSMIFIRNLTMRFAEAESFYKGMQSQVKAGGVVGYGPFILGGTYKSSNSEYSSESHYDSQGIHVPGMQVIGFKCHLLPKSPNPNPAIEKWI